MKMLRWLGYILLTLLIVSIPAYWWLAIESHVSSTADFTIDMAIVRRLAAASVGARPLAIRVETVGHVSVPETLVIAGGGWQRLDMPVSAYELVYKDHAMILDTTFDSNVARQMGVTAYDEAAFARVSAALAAAQLIIVTHEHPDHLGGLLAQSRLTDLIGKTRLTRVQIAELKKAVHEDPMAPLNVPPSVFDGYPAIEYAHYKTIAPGVVLIKAPGHTPGSQMVYVERADGAEMLFLGDVAWQMRNIEAVRERARLVTWLAGEDRDAVMGELVELSRLHASEPSIHFMPGHDPEALARFLKAGLLQKGF